MKNEFHKQAVFLFLIILILSIIFLVGLYIFKNNILEKENSIIDDTSISLKFVEDNGITIANMLPITDEVGRKIDTSGDKQGIQGYFDFTISSRVDEDVRYEVYLTKEEYEKEIESNYIKIYLTDALTDKPFSGYEKNSVPTYYDLKVSSSDPAGKRLYYGTLSNKDSDKFRLRMWLSDSYVITAEERKFAVKVNVKVD